MHKLDSPLSIKAYCLFVGNTNLKGCCSHENNKISQVSYYFVQMFTIHNTDGALYIIT